MPTRVICIRPEPGCAATVDRGKQMGLQIEAMPLFEVEPVAWEAPDPSCFDGLLIGSANAIRHGGPQLASLLDLPVFAVGQTTAVMAEKAGFGIEQVGSGGLQSLLEALDNRYRRLLRLSGEARVSLTPSANQKIEDLIVYRSHPISTPAAMVDYAKDGAIIALHSANAAEHFSHEIKRLGIERSKISVAAFGQRVADAAGDGWAQIMVSPQPNDAALLAMIGNMCK